MSHMQRCQATAAGPPARQVGELRLAPLAAPTRSALARAQRHGAESTAGRRSVALQRPRSLAARAAGAAGAAAAQGAPAAGRGRIGDEYFANDRRHVVLFDGVCNLCNGGVNFMLDWDREGRFRFAALQSAAGRALLQRSGRSPDDISSIVLCEADGRAFIKSAAILRIAAGLQAPLPLVAAALDVFPRPFKDVVYDGVANNRYLVFGKTASCRLGDSRFEDRFLA